MKLETMRVVRRSDGRSIVINVSDYDSHSHEQITEGAPLSERELYERYEKEGWRAISDLAESVGLSKHPDGWRETIPDLANALEDFRND
jgi:hypothetical protein